MFEPNPFDELRKKMKTSGTLAVQEVVEGRFFSFEPYKSGEGLPIAFVTGLRVSGDFSFVPVDPQSLGSHALAAAVYMRHVLKSEVTGSTMLAPQAVSQRPAKLIFDKATGLKLFTEGSLTFDIEFSPKEWARTVRSSVVTIGFRSLSGAPLKIAGSLNVHAQD